MKGREIWYDLSMILSKLFEYIASVFAINCTSPPFMVPKISELIGYGNVTGKKDEMTVEKCRKLTSWDKILNQFYRDVDLNSVIEGINPVYD